MTRTRRSVHTFNFLKPRLCQEFVRSTTRREGVTIYDHLVREEMMRVQSWSSEIGMGWTSMPQTYASDYLE
ncbi:hypothetical protein COCCU_12950 [Corynebacterium occultum]|uniref:Uncharacterized protein n=1 Tax=Corynebacterium occultum TaxID=2675219 RepID=A0A6B8VZR6_9CORY|nr:hypothetical protein COCCU_12950 [Corynebacterium occultum]